MLNPPLSLLSDDLLNYIVDHVAEFRDLFSFSFPFSNSNSNLHNLSITDRAFTRACQAYIFKDLRLGFGCRTKDSLSKRLVKIGNILNDEPSFANRVRTVHLGYTCTQNKWLFNDPNFITVFQLLAKSLMPPHKLCLIGDWESFIIEDPIFFVGCLMQSFFSQTLTVLELTYCENVPLTLFLVCPNLKEVYLDGVEVFESGDDEYPDEQCYGRELPALELLNCRDSKGLVKQMITPPPKFSTAVAVWSKLRVLKLGPQEKEEVACVQPILDAACNTLEELCLFNRQDTWVAERVRLAGLVDLRRLANLHILSIHSIIKCRVPERVVLRDIDLVLSTIPKTNQVTKLSLDFAICGKRPFAECLEEDWVGMCAEVVRISAGKPFELDLDIWTNPHVYNHIYPGRDELCERIKEKTASLSEYPNICIHWGAFSEI